MTARYFITMTDEERRAMAYGLSIFVEKLTQATPVIDDNPHAETGNGQALPAVPAVSTPPTPTPVETRDRWARDKNGVELPNPSGCEMIPNIAIWKTKESKSAKNSVPYLRVTWPALNSEGYVDANCFDQKLWPWLIKVQKENVRTTLYVVRHGNYLNVVGVRA